MLTLIRLNKLILDGNIIKIATNQQKNRRKCKFVFFINKSHNTTKRDIFTNTLLTSFRK